MKTGSRGKTILILGIITLLIIACCLITGIAYGIPNRAADLFGPPDSGLSLWKLYTQSLILTISRQSLFEPVYQAAPELSFPIQAGDSLESILDNLSQLGYIPHRDAFRAYLIYSGIDKRIQPGEYRFKPGTSEIELAHQLADPIPQQTILTILPGWRAEEIGERLHDLGLDITAEDFILAVRDENREGYLFPGSYQLERAITAGELVDYLYQQFLGQITPDLESQLTSRGLTLQQAVILASIIQREAVLEEEMPLIASVFYNRLEAGMKLEADPTVQYALGYNPVQASWWTNPLTAEDLGYPSPYNTYLSGGLPPGPISNPGMAALHAATQPAASAYLYFRAACDGSGRHLFAETYQDHLDNACP
jgi:UPF0755 protein